MNILMPGYNYLSGYQGIPQRFNDINHYLIKIIEHVQQDISINMEMLFVKGT